MTDSSFTESVREVMEIMAQFPNLTIQEAVDKRREIKEAEMQLFWDIQREIMRQQAEQEAADAEWEAGLEDNL